MRLKSIDLGQMGTSLYEKKRVSHFLTEPLFPLSSLEEESDGMGVYGVEWGRYAC